VWQTIEWLRYFYSYIDLCLVSFVLERRANEVSDYTYPLV